MEMACNSSAENRTTEPTGSFLASPQSLDASRKQVVAFGAPATQSTQDTPALTSRAKLKLWLQSLATNGPREGKPNDGTRPSIRSDSAISNPHGSSERASANEQHGGKRASLPTAKMSVVDILNYHKRKRSELLSRCGMDMPPLSFSDKRPDIPDGPSSNALGRSKATEGNSVGCPDSFVPSKTSCSDAFDHALAHEIAAKHEAQDPIDEKTRLFAKRATPCLGDVVTNTQERSGQGEAGEPALSAEVLPQVHLVSIEAGTPLSTNGSVVANANKSTDESSNYDVAVRSGSSSFRPEESIGKTSISLKLDEANSSYREGIAAYADQAFAKSVGKVSPSETPQESERSTLRITSTITSNGNVQTSELCDKSDSQSFLVSAKLEVGHTTPHIIVPKVGVQKELEISALNEQQNRIPETICSDLASGKIDVRITAQLCDDTRQPAPTLKIEDSWSPNSTEVASEVIKEPFFFEKIGLDCRDVSLHIAKANVTSSSDILSMADGLRANSDNRDAQSQTKQVDPWLISTPNVKSSAQVLDQHLESMITPEKFCQSSQAKAPQQHIAYRGANTDVLAKNSNTLSVSPACRTTSEQRITSQIEDFPQRIEQSLGTKAQACESQDDPSNESFVRPRSKAASTRISSIVFDEGPVVDIPMKRPASKAFLRHQLADMSVKYPANGLGFATCNDDVPHSVKVDKESNSRLVENATGETHENNISMGFGQASGMGSDSELGEQVTTLCRSSRYPNKVPPLQCSSAEASMHDVVVSRSKMGEPLERGLGVDVCTLVGVQSKTKPFKDREEEALWYDIWGIVEENNAKGSLALCDPASSTHCIVPFAGKGCLQGAKGLKHGNANALATRSAPVCKARKARPAPRALADHEKRGHYDILGLRRTATAADVRKAYRSQALATHPDKGGDAAQFRDVAKAFEVLGDVASRADYDAMLDEIGCSDGQAASSACHDHEVEPDLTCRAALRAVIIVYETILRSGDKDWPQLLASLVGDSLNALKALALSHRVLPPSLLQTFSAKTTSLKTQSTASGIKFMQRDEQGYTLTMSLASLTIFTGYTQVLAHAIDWQIALARALSSAQQRLRQNREAHNLIIEEPLVDCELEQIYDSEPGLQLFFSFTLQTKGQRVVTPAVKSFSRAKELRGRLRAALERGKPGPKLQKERQLLVKELEADRADSQALDDRLVEAIEKHIANRAAEVDVRVAKFREQYEKGMKRKECPSEMLAIGPSKRLRKKTTLPGTVPEAAKLVPSKRLRTKTSMDVLLALPAPEPTKRIRQKTSLVLALPALEPTKRLRQKTSLSSLVSLPAPK